MMLLSAGSGRGVRVTSSALPGVVKLVESYLLVTSLNEKYRLFFTTCKFSSNIHIFRHFYLLK